MSTQVAVIPVEGVSPEVAVIIGNLNKAAKLVSKVQSFNLLWKGISTAINNNRPAGETILAMMDEKHPLYKRVKNLVNPKEKGDKNWTKLLADANPNTIAAWLQAKGWTVVAPS